MSLSATFAPNRVNLVTSQDDYPSSRLNVQRFLHAGVHPIPECRQRAAMAQCPARWDDTQASSAASRLQTRHDNTRVFIRHSIQLNVGQHPTAAHLIEDLRMWGRWSTMEAVGIVPAGYFENTIVFRAEQASNQNYASARRNATPDAATQAARLQPDPQTGTHRSQPQRRPCPRHLLEAGSQALTQHRLQLHNRLQAHRDRRRQTTILPAHQRVRQRMASEQLLVDETLRMIGQQHLEDIKLKAAENDTRQDRALGTVVLGAVQRLRSEHDVYLSQALRDLDQKEGIDGSIGTSDWYQDDEDDGDHEHESGNDDSVLLRRRARVLGRWMAEHYL